MENIRETIVFKVQHTRMGGWIIDNSSDPEKDFEFQPAGIFATVWIVTETCNFFSLKPSPEINDAIKEKIRMENLFGSRENNEAVRHIIIKKSELI